MKPYSTTRQTRDDQAELKRRFTSADRARIAHAESIGYERQAPFFAWLKPRSRGRIVFVHELPDVPAKAKRPPTRKRSPKPDYSLCQRCDKSLRECECHAEE